MISICVSLFYKRDESLLFIRRMIDYFK